MWPGGLKLMSNANILNTTKNTANETPPIQSHIFLLVAYASVTSNHLFAKVVYRPNAIARMSALMPSTKHKLQLPTIKRRKHEPSNPTCRCKRCSLNLSRWADQDGSANDPNAVPDPEQVRREVPRATDKCEKCGRDMVIRRSRRENF